MFAINIIKSPVEFIPINLGKEINSEMSEYHPFISADEKQFIITRKVKGEFDLQEDFFYSQKDEENNWKKVKKMSSINTPSNEGAISISSDEIVTFNPFCRASNSAFCRANLQPSFVEISSPCMKLPFA